MTQTIEIRGVEYPVAPVSEVVLMPLISALGADNPGQFAQMAATDREGYAQQIMARLTEPVWHPKIAYTIKAMVPALDPTLVDYKLLRYPDGTHEERCVLALHMGELAPLIQSALETFMGTATQAKQPAKPNAAKSKTPSGFGDLARQAPRKIKPEAPPPALPEADPIPAQDLDPLLDDLQELELGDFSQDELDDYADMLSTTPDLTEGVSPEVLAAIEGDPNRDVILRALQEARSPQPNPVS